LLKPTSVKHNYISLFSGCGGFDLGFNSEGFKCVGAFDIDPNVIAVYKNNIGGAIFQHDLNIVDLPVQKKIDVVVSGSPCQGFSTLGKRKLSDPRNQLLIKGGQIAIKYNAKLFIAENVLGSLSGNHKKYWSQLIALLTKHGYHTHLEKYNAQDYGLAQIRKRLILYAWKGKKNIAINFQNQINSQDITPLKNILKNLQGVKNHNPIYLDSNCSDYKIANAIKNGQKLSNVRGGERSVHTWQIPEVFGKTTRDERRMLEFIKTHRRKIRKRKKGDADPLELSFLYQNCKIRNCKEIVESLINKNYLRILNKETIDLKHTFNGKFRRLNIEDPSLTVDSHFCNFRYFLHPNENRAFTVREAARIQGFSDEFIFDGPISKQISMIGNAVPPPLARHIAKVANQILIKIS
jgi:DNA (cytosine-5)-methyltransferase 1